MATSLKPRSLVTCDLRGFSRRPGGNVLARPARMASHESEMMWTIDEISQLITQRGNASETLQDVVHLVQRRFHTDVCSAYLLEPDRANLVLAATLGLRKECIGTLRLALHEGLAGLVAEQVHPVAVDKVSQH